MKKVLTGILTLITAVSFLSPCFHYWRAKNVQFLILNYAL